MKHISSQKLPARLQDWFNTLSMEIRKDQAGMGDDIAGKENFYFPAKCRSSLEQVRGNLSLMLKRLAGNVPYWIFRRLEEMEELFGWFLKKDTRYVLFLQTAGEILCLWLLAERFQGFSMIPYGTGDFPRFSPVEL